MRLIELYLKKQSIKLC